MSLQMENTFIIPPHRIEGLVPCDPRVVGAVIGTKGAHLEEIRLQTGDGCFIRYEDQRLPRQQMEGHFYIQANSHEAVGNAIALLQQAEKDVRRKILDKRQRTAQKRSKQPKQPRHPWPPRPSGDATTTVWPETKVQRLPPRKVEPVPLEPGTLVIKKENLQA